MQISYQCTVIVVCELCTSYSIQCALGYNTEVMFVEQEALDVLDQFKKDLEDIEQTLVERNKKLEVPYEYLLPRLIVNSISI